MEQLIRWIIAGGIVAGGFDLLLDNRFHLGEHFEKGFYLLGNLALSMTGILCFAPLLAKALKLTLAPLYTRLGLDAGTLGGMLAMDMGGYPAAMALAEDEEIGRFSGILLGGTLGCTLSFSIPFGISTLSKTQQEEFGRGIMLGLAVLPVCLLSGGLIEGISFTQLLFELLPVLLLAFLLILGIGLFSHKLMAAFTLFAGALRVLSIVGLMLGALQYILKIELPLNLMPIEEALETVAGIGVVLLGSLPAAELLRRLLAAPMKKLSKKLGISEQSLSALLVGYVSVTAELVLLKDLDRRGRIVNTAFAVCGGSALSAYLGYTLNAEPQLVTAMLLSKLIGGLLGAGAALWLTGRTNTVVDNEK